MSRVKQITIDTTDWLLINILAPFVLPLFFAYGFCRFNTKIQYDIIDILVLLLKNGVYTFLGLTILISLFQDYRTVRNAYGIFFWAFFFFASTMTSFIFASSLGFITGNIAISFEHNLESFIILTSAIVAVSIVFKIFITSKKYR
jgi:hypothetical protein